MSDKFNKLDKFRVTSGPWSSAPGSSYGFFFIPFSIGKTPLKVMSAPFDGGEWEHVSVSLPGRCPTWEEMSFIKSLFWETEECVVQFHPPASEYVNNSNFCLHLWRNTKVPTPTPPSIMVGVKGFGRLD